MPSKLSKEQRIKLIKRVLESGESVTFVCKEAGVSRVVFYRWLAYYKNEQEQQKNLPPKKLSPHSRIDVIERVAAGESVARICELYGISRTLFYRWQDRYEKAPEGQKLEALWDKKPVVERYYKQASEEYEEAVLAAVRTYPELSTHKIVDVLPHVGGRSILGNHGVQNVLKRHNLNTYESRMAFAAEFHKPTTSTRFFGIFHKLLTLITTQSPQPRSASVRFAFISAFALFTVVSLFGTHQLFRLIFGSPSFVFSIGLMFSLVSLLFGMLFFVYSIKYYFTIAVVLSFSRHSGEKEDQEKESYFNTIYSRIFGRNSLQVSNQYSGSGGLQPDLSGITLERKPFVSIQLASYNEKHVIDRLLTAATSMEYENYEVILADDSNDETLEIIKKWEDHPRVTVVHRENREGYKGMALQNALHYTDKRAEFMIIFDADFIPYPDTITQFLKHFQSIEGDLKPQTIKRSKIGALQGYQWHVLNKSENWITRGVRSEYAGSYVIERSAAEVYGGLKQIAGSVYMIRKDVVEQIGWGKSITEDFEFTLKMYEQGYKVVYTPYIQAPAEAVSTIKRMIRQRMRWAEGHSFNIKKMLVKLLVSTNLTTAEKLEVVYLTPYYLQAAFFIVGTLCWFIAEVIFQVRLPFWTETWGWSLVFTNMFALPLMNMVGLFLEESEEKDYLGLFSFIGLSYIVAPFQAYAAAKGFLEKEEGPWFRTPKSGKITDVFTPGRFYRYIFGFFGRGKEAAHANSPQIGIAQMHSNTFGEFSFAFNSHSIIKPFEYNPYLVMETSHNRFSNFRVRPRGLKRLGNIVLFGLITTSILLSSFSRSVPTINAPVYAAESLTKAIDQDVKSQKIASLFPESPAKQELDEKNAEQITTPRIIRKKTTGGKDIEFIFHKEPRVRISLEGQEIEFETKQIGGMMVEPQKSLIFSTNVVLYKDVIDGVDIMYTFGGDLLVEEFIVKDKTAARFFDQPIEQDVKTVDVSVVSPDPKSFGFYSKEGKELYRFGEPFAKDSDDEKTHDISIKIAKQQIGHNLTKTLGKSAKAWLQDPMRAYPVSIDPSVIVTGGIVDGDVQFGGLQRKVVFVNSAFYAFYGDAGEIWYKKSTNGGATWGSAVQVSIVAGADADNYNPSVDVVEGMIMAFWVDGDTDSIQGRRLVTATDTLNTTECTGTDLGTFTDDTTFMVSVAALGATRAVVTISDTSSDTEFDITYVETLEGTCAVTVDMNDTADNSSSPGPGLTAGDRPVVVRLDQQGWEAGDGADNFVRQAGIVFQDGNLSFSRAMMSQYGGTNNTWIDWVSNNLTIAQVTDDVFSVTTDGVYVWVLTRAGTVSATSTNLYKCCKDSYTPTVIDSDIGEADDENWPVDIYCVAADNCKIIYYDDADGDNADLTFVDCADTLCSAGTTSTDVDIDATATDNAGAVVGGALSLYCVADDNCKILYLDLLGGVSTDLTFVDCGTSICDGTGRTSAVIDSDVIGSNVAADNNIVCIADNDCKLAFYDGSANDEMFTDCGNSDCSTRTTTSIDAAMGVGAKTDLSCPASDDCKLVYFDGPTNEDNLEFIDCANTLCTTRTTTTLDADAGLTDAMTIDCLSTTNCKVASMDTTNGYMHFWDCSDTLCTNTLTNYDNDSGVNIEANYIDMDCVADDDCKIVYPGVTLSTERRLFFIDCDDTICTTGSNSLLPPSAQLSGALSCPASDDCKLVYIKSNAGVDASLEFVDLSTTNGFPDGRWDMYDIDTDSANESNQASIYCPAANDCKIVYQDSTDNDLTFADCNDVNCSSPTLTDININTPQIAASGIYCVSATDCKIIYSDETDTSIEFVDCNNATCSSNTPTEVDSDSAETFADIYCIATDDCKIIYGDTGTDVSSTTDLTFIDCGTSVCDSTGRTITDIDTDVGVLTKPGPVAIYCPAADDCKISYLDDSEDDLNFVDCGNTICSSPTVSDLFTTALDTGFIQSDIYCPSTSNCKVVYNDSSEGDITFVDCADTVCSTGGQTKTDLDTDVNVTVYNNVSISCPASDDCKVVYGDSIDDDTTFADCNNETCTAPVFTDIDAEGSGTVHGPDGNDIFCVSAIDCKIVYLDNAEGDTTFVNCNDALCSPMALEPPFTGETELESVSITMDGGGVQEEVLSSSGLVGHWGMDESAWTSNCSTEEVIDSSGNINHGESCPNGAANDPVAGKYGNAGSFDGTNDYVQVDDDATLRPSTFTIAFWVKKVTAEPDDYDFIMEKYKNTSIEEGWAILFNNSVSKKVYFAARNTSGTETNTASKSVVAPAVGEWAHFAYTFDGSTITTYENGVSRGTTSFTGTFQPSTNPLRFATQQAVGNYATIEMDETRIYNRVLSATEIDILYDGIGPMGHWKMDDSSWTNDCSTGTVNDTGGSNDLKSCPNGSGPTTPATGNYNTAVDLNGTSQYLETPTSPGLPTGDFTYAAWIYLDANTDEMIFMASDSLGANELAIHVSGGNAITVYLDNIQLFSTTTTLSTVTWIHVAVTRSGSSVKAYINGLVDATTGSNSTVLAFGTCQLLIGTDADGSCNATLGNYFDGKIDDVRVYNRGLSAREIDNLYDLGPGPVGHWEMDETSWTNDCSTTSVIDSSGNVHNGISCPNGSGVSTLSAGIFGNAADLNGSSQYIQVNSPNLPTTDFTYAAWVNLDANTDEVLFMASDGVTNEFMVYVLASSKIEVIGHNNTDLIAATTSTVPTKQWTHIAVTRLGSTVKVYFNGVQDATTGSDSTAMGFSTCALLIGVDADSGCTGALSNYLDGKIDDVRIYDRALTATEITVLNTFTRTLYAHVISDSSDQAYFKSSDASTISWACGDATECSYGFTAGDLAHISSNITASSSAQVGVSLRQGANYEFATVPENLGMLLLIAPLLPGLVRKRRKIFSVIPNLIRDLRR